MEVSFIVVKRVKICNSDRDKHLSKHRNSKAGSLIMKFVRCLCWGGSILFSLECRIYQTHNKDFIIDQYCWLRIRLRGSPHRTEPQILREAFSSCFSYKWERKKRQFSITVIKRGRLWSETRVQFLTLSYNNSDRVFLFLKITYLGLRFLISKMRSVALKVKSKNSRETVNPGPGSVHAAKCRYFPGRRSDLLKSHSQLEINLKITRFPNSLSCAFSITTAPCQKRAARQVT